MSDRQLCERYRDAGVFVCASEHEGFCVPLIEAFHKQIPVMAYAATAVPATMDGAGVLFDTKDPLHVAMLMDGVLSFEAQSQPVAESELDRIAMLLPAPRRAVRGTSGGRRRDSSA